MILTVKLTFTFTKLKNDIKYYKIKPISQISEHI